MLKVICAWCKKVISNPDNSKEISHGICGECSKKEFQKFMDKKCPVNKVK
jgi:hypothetical protein